MAGWGGCVVPLNELTSDCLPSSRINAVRLWSAVMVGQVRKLRVSSSVKALPFGKAGADIRLLLEA